MAAAETDKAAEAAVGEGEMVQTITPPTKTDRKLKAAVRTDAKEVCRSRRDYALMAMGTSMGPAVRRPQEKVGPAIRSPQTGQFIELDGGNLRGASRQAPTGEGGSRRQAPTDERENYVGPVIWHPQEKVGPSVRRPQDISEACHHGAYSEVSHRCSQNISESCHVAHTVRLPSRRSQNISVACHRRSHSETCHRGAYYVH